MAQAHSCKLQRTAVAPNNAVLLAFFLCLSLLVVSTSSAGLTSVYVNSGVGVNVSGPATTAPGAAQGVWLSKKLFAFVWQNYTDSLILTTVCPPLLGLLFRILASALLTARPISSHTRRAS